MNRIENMIDYQDRKRTKENESDDSVRVCSLNKKNVSPLIMMNNASKWQPSYHQYCMTYLCDSGTYLGSKHIE